MSTISPPVWLDRNFVETALKADVRHYDVSTLGAAGDGYTSSLYRVKVELQGGDRHSVIVKRLVETGNAGKCIGESTMFARETEMYEVTLPKLVELLEKALPGKIPPMAPRHIFSSTGVLVMEDLTASGFKMVDRHQGLDLDHSLLVMRTLARFHAASVILQEREPDSMTLYNNSIYSESTSQETLGYFFTAMSVMLADEVAKWPEFGNPYAEKLRAMSTNMMELTAWASRRQVGRFNVLTHDDLWINNLMFRDPDCVRIIDFQFPHFTSLGNDLHLFVISSLTDDVRRNHVNALLQEYHIVFCDTLTALGYTGTLITMDELKEEFAKSSLYAMAISIVFQPVTMAPADYDVSVFESLDKSIYNNSNYMATMREMLKIFDSQGAFLMAEEFLNLNR